METLEKFYTVICIKAIRPPTGRAKSATIETYDHGSFSMWPDKLGLMRVDQCYNIEYSEKLADNGVTYRNIQGTPHHLGPYTPPEPKPHPLSAAVTAKPASAGSGATSNVAERNGNGHREFMISALALYNHSFPSYAARMAGPIDEHMMGDFLFRCMLAVNNAQAKWDETAGG